MTRTAPARAAWLAGAVTACAAAGLLAALRPAPLLHGLSDESLLVPLARRSWDASLYTTDTWLEYARRVFGHVYSVLLGGFLRIADDPVAAGRLLALPFQAAFLAGCFRIVERATGRGTAWAATLSIAALPHVSAACGGPEWPLATGASLPRDLVFALVPWLWIARDAAIASGRLGRRIAAGFAVGVLANLHPLTAIHALVVFGILDLLRTPSRTAVRDAVAIGFVAIHGAVPYLVQWGHFPSTPGQAPREIMLWRIEGIGAWTPSLWAERVETAAWCVAAAIVLGRGRPDPSRRTLRLAAVAALAVCAAAPALNAVVDGIQFDRMNRFAVLFACLAAACELPSALRARDRAGIALGLALFATAVGGRSVVRAATGADRGPVEFVVRRVEVRAGLAESERKAPMEERERPRDPSLDPSLGAAFREVCAWVRANTPKDAVVLVPPEEFGAFRAYAVRSVTVTRKEGGFALSFLGGRGTEWFDEYRMTVEAIAKGGPALAEEAANHRARWAVVDDAATAAPPGWTEAFAAGPYRVLRAK